MNAHDFFGILSSRTSSSCCSEAPWPFPARLLGSEINSESLLMLLAFYSNLRFRGSMRLIVTFDDILLAIL